MPLFFWLLDVIVNNSYLVMKAAGSQIDHSTSRLDLAWDLIELATRKKGYRTRESAQGEQTPPLPVSTKPLKNPRITKHSNEPNFPQHLTKNRHLPILVDDRKACTWCRMQAKAGKFLISKQNLLRFYILALNITNM